MTLPEKARRGKPALAYIANQFPCSVEPYVADEIQELKARGVQVLACSIRESCAGPEEDPHCMAAGTLYLRPLQWRLVARALWLSIREAGKLQDLFWRILARGEESPGRRLRAVLHTVLGAYYALLLDKRGVEHIHAHHGYCASWVAMVAARLTGKTFSLTLHGSDLLVHADYLDLKLANCKFCLTVSEFNRRHILQHYPRIDSGKILVRHLGVRVQSPACESLLSQQEGEDPLILLSVGRLHPVKDHAFLVKACRLLKDRRVRFLCLIVGEGPEHAALERLIRKLDLQQQVKLLGYIPRENLGSYYRACDLFSLTSRSEGIPIVLMEAMAHGKVVLAPAITGIPELVEDGHTGFLYPAGSIAAFVERVEMIQRLGPSLAYLRREARRQIWSNFNWEKNLPAMIDVLLARLQEPAQNLPYEDPLLQQV